VAQPYPILEFDPDPDAVIRPDGIPRPKDMPQCAVICFFKEVLDALVASGRAERLATLRSESGEHPIYAVSLGDRRVAAFHPGVGAPLSAGLLEEVIWLGSRKFIACGGCGVLNREITAGHLVVPVSAIRDEGTSYHYLPPSREAHPSVEAVRAIESVLRQHDVPYLLGKTWTTDAFYRETRAKIARRRDEGCLVVEMEAAAFFAVAQFRGVTFGQLLYAGDDVSGDEWDFRDWVRQPVRERLFWLAVEACLAIP
jgi:uridine phosphorylase